MKKYFNLMLAVPVFALAMVSCSDDDNDGSGFSDKPGKVEMNSDDLAVVGKCNDFGFKLMEAAGKSAELTGKNFVISPLSVNYAFAMLANGANGDTRDQIVKTLGYNNFNIAEVNSLNKKMTTELSKLDSKVTLNFANSMWAKASIPVNGSFSATLTEYYDAEIMEINPATYISDVNSWCSKKTNGKITEFLSMDASIHDFALYNAVYFKGLWSNACKFDKKRTNDGYFNNADGTRSIAKFMSKISSMAYGKSTSMQKCELDFGNTSFRVAFILPDEGVSLAEASNRLTEGEWDELSLMQSAIVTLSLPKFKTESEINLTMLLPGLGMTDVFTASADYSSISSASFKVTSATQKSFFEINEDGAEAAAVTGIGMETAGPTHPKEVTLTFDRPFIYVLYERSSGAILFIGQVNTFAL